MESQTCPGEFLNSKEWDARLIASESEIEVECVVNWYIASQRYIRSNGDATRQ